MEVLKRHMNVQPPSSHDLLEAWREDDEPLTYDIFIARYSIYIKIHVYLQLCKAMMRATVSDILLHKHTKSDVFMADSEITKLYI